LVGEILKKRREELGRDLREISNYLKIRYDYLKALEDGDIEKLPAEVYIRGYIQ
jgi:cytoskeleton protein RodZ